MQVKSLGFKTDLYFHSFSGLVLETRDCLVIKTPTNPKFFWGNLLYFPNAPTAESFLKWTTLFKEQFCSMDVDHVTFAWDSISGEEGVLGPFLQDGFHLEKSIVMSAQSVIRPKKYFNDLTVRPIESEEEWLMVIENQVLSRADNFLERPYRKFTLNKMANFRLMVKEKKGFWMGAFLNKQLVGDLGIFSENGLARFQTVGTHPQFRRLGVCSTLVYETCLLAQQALGAKEFVMVADPEYHAAKIYESVGFKPTEIQIGMCKYNKEIWAT